MLFFRKICLASFSFSHRLRIANRPFVLFPPMFQIQILMYSAWVFDTRSHQIHEKTCFLVTLEIYMRVGVESWGVLDLLLSGWPLADAKQCYSKIILNFYHTTQVILNVSLNQKQTRPDNPYKHTTCIAHWNDVETTVSTSF